MIRPRPPRLPYPFIPPLDPPAEEPPYIPPETTGEDPGPRPPWLPEGWPWPLPPRGRTSGYRIAATAPRYHLATAPAQSSLLRPTRLPLPG